jgi:hypothetical protein
MRILTIHFTLALLGGLLLAGCAADGGSRSADEDDGAGDAPRLYGELNTSIDYVETR